MTIEPFDVAIIGGSIAGLSAALTLGRSLRRVVVIDSETPCNRTSPFSHNFITHDGDTPAEIVRQARAQIAAYENVMFLKDLAVDAKYGGDIFQVVTQSGSVIRATRVLLCTGLTDLLPDITGFQDCWGISILHCPYCHGYEVKGKRTAVLANGQAAFHVTMLIRNWTKDIVLLTNGRSELRPEEKEILDGLGVAVVETEVSSLAHQDGLISSIRFADDSVVETEAIYASVPFAQQSNLAEMLGCKMTAKGHVEVDALGRTTVPGVYAAGDNTAEHRAIAVASAAGTVAGFTINADHVVPQLQP